MKVRWLVTGKVHGVWGIVADTGECLVHAMLEEVERTFPALASSMWTLAFYQVPVFGIPLTDGSRVGRLYGSEIFELKATQRGVQGLRLAFFLESDPATEPREDRWPVVVCTHAFYKLSGTPPGEVARARTLRQRYLDAKTAGQLEILDY